MGKTVEERLEAKRQYNKQYRQVNKEKIAEYNKQRYQDNREEILEHSKQYYQENKKKKVEYYQANKEKIAEYKKRYNRTPMRRASMLVNAHNQNDKKHNRGECSLTALWIHNYIFPFKCVYCGESDWHKLGCDRKDNSLPHTPSNVVPCCEACNKKRGRKPFETFVAECNAQERLKEWEEFLKQKDLENIATS